MPRLTQAMGEGLKGVGLEKELEAAAGAPERIVWDSQLKGFGLRLFTSGRRSWLVQYRAAGRQRRISLGDAAVVSVGEARAQARQLLAQSDLGRDPQAERQAARRTLTVRQLIDLYLERQARPRVKARSLVEIERHLLVKAKALHPLGAAAVGRADVARLLARVASSTPVQANRVRASLSAMFAWATAQGLVAANPVAGIGKPTAEKARTRVLTPDELAEVWRHAGGGTYARVVRLILLTGARRDEVGGMRAGEVDGNGLWILPAERSKNGRAIDRPLPMAARALLPKREGGAAAPVFGFGAEAATGFQGWAMAKARLTARITRARAAAQLEPLADWTLHDLRRSVATALGELGIAMPHVVETLLGHRHEKTGSAHAVYNRARYRVETGRALAVWAEHLMGLVDGVERDGQVVAFPSVRVAELA